ncbi:hypothetical protein QP613_10320, partial [Aerococcus urinae]|nr:hypothetical protein [Aerococcus urinae]
RILSELTAVVWAMAHKKALPGQGFMASVSESGGGCALPGLQTLFVAPVSEAPPGFFQKL